MQKLITNTGTSPMYEGNTMIPPGESRLVEMPGAAPAQEAPAAPSLPELLAALLERSIAAITPEIPTLTNEALEQAYAMEQEGKKRSTLLAALQAEGMRRADEKLREEDAARVAAALEAARAELLTASVAQKNLPPEASETERQAAEAAVQEAQAKVDALTPKTE